MSGLTVNGYIHSPSKGKIPFHIGSTAVSMDNYVSLDGEEIISGKKTFTSNETAFSKSILLTPDGSTSSISINFFRWSERCFLVF